MSLNPCICSGVIGLLEPVLAAAKLGRGTAWTGHSLVCRRATESHRHLYILTFISINQPMEAGENPCMNGKTGQLQTERIKSGFKQEASCYQIKELIFLYLFFCPFLKKKLSIERTSLSQKQTNIFFKPTQWSSKEWKVVSSNPWSSPTKDSQIWDQNTSLLDTQRKWLEGQTKSPNGCRAQLGDGSNAENKYHTPSV